MLCLRETYLGEVCTTSELLCWGLGDGDSGLSLEHSCLEPRSFRLPASEELSSTDDELGSVLERAAIEYALAPRH